MKVSIGSLLQKRALMHPQKEALVDVEQGKRLTYEQYNRYANRAANAIRGLGVKKGDRVALLLGNGSQYMEFFFALAKLGAVCVPLNWRLTPDELASILEDSGAETLIYGDAFREAAADVHSRGEDATAVRRWVHLGESVDLFSLRLGDLLASASDDEPDLAGFEDDPLFIMYTSGTTGLPKGVVHTHNTVLWAVASMAITQEMRNSDRFLVALPLFHVGALSPAIMSVYCGITAVVSSGFDPVVFWKTIEAERVTNTLMVPTILTVMLQAQEKDLCDHTALRWVAVAGAPVPISLLEAYRPLGDSPRRAGRPACSPEKTWPVKPGLRASPFFTTKFGSSTLAAGMSGPANVANCSSKASTSCESTGSSRRRRPRRCGTGGFIPGTWQRSTTRGSSPSWTGSRT
jgi:acyl-CoA synthetase (AMP-forming)/AMP-acid ligase II